MTMASNTESQGEKPLRNIVIVGARGNIGSAMISALLAHNASQPPPPPTPPHQHPFTFTITVLLRPTSPPYHPPPYDPSTTTLTSQVVADFTSPSSLTQTLLTLPHSPPDALLICLPAGTVTLSSQQPLIDAAIGAGVRLIVPSEYVADVMSAQFGKFPTGVVGEKRRVRAYLEERLGSGRGRGSGSGSGAETSTDKTKKTKTKWASVNGGPFADMWLPKFFDPTARKATIYGPGTNPTCWTPRSTTAHAVLHLLTHFHLPPYSTSSTFTPLVNRAHFISGVHPPITMNAILAAAEAYTGGQPWEVERHPIEPIRAEAERAGERGDEKALTRCLTLLSQFDAEGWQGRAADFSGKGLSNGVLGVEAVGVEEMVGREIERVMGGNV